MTDAHPDFGPEQRQWLANQCIRLKHGHCTTARCLIRGGYRHGDGKSEAMSYQERLALATCEPYEIHCLLDSTTGKTEGG